MYTIEKNIPIPIYHKYPLDELAKGDSFSVEGKSPNQITPYFSRYRPKKFKTRSIEGGVRIWRIK